MEVKSTTTNRVQSLILIAAITGWLLAIVLGVILIEALARDPSSVVNASPGPSDGHRTAGLQEGAYILTLRNASSEAVTALDIEYCGWHRTLSGGLAQGAQTQIGHSMVAPWPINISVEYQSGHKKTFEWSSMGSYDGLRFAIMDDSIQPVDARIPPTFGE